MVGIFFPAVVFIWVIFVKLKQIKMNGFNSLIEVEEDGLFTPEVREWSKEKYRLVGSYCDIFTSGMKNNWDQLVYIDLYAGAGYARIKETQKIYKSSSLIALSIPKPFTKYIFVEADLKRCEALQSRVNRDYKDFDVEIINGDCNCLVDEIIRSIPKFSKSNTLLPFCFIDPFSLNLNFKTIQRLGTNRLMDFLILQALHMDANRNLTKYLNDENDKISLYLSSPQWRDDFNREYMMYSNNFVKFLADQYQKQMKKFDYINDQQMHQIRSNVKNLPLYYLAFYSKHKRGIDFFKRIKKYANPQMKMEF